MITYTDLAEITEPLGPSAVTIGKFDGVHLGHQAVLAELIGVSQQRGLRSIVITFDRHPLAQLDPLSRPQVLVGNEQKLELIAESGVDTTLFLRFDKALASMTPRDFVKTVLVDVCGTAVVMVGHDFRFGTEGAGTIDTLRELGAEFGFEVDVIPEVSPEGERKISSSWIRDLLNEGDVERATDFLGRAPAVRGEVVHGAKRGRELGFPTANLSPQSEGLIPADGVYAGWLTDGDERYPAAISVGSNPTFDGVPPKQVEAFVLDRDLDLYDHIVEVSFVARIRGMVRFTGIDPLIEQMNADVEGVRAILGDG
ncbi:bifunctional riboflavin kinase/FAD synthetase [Herbiconiux moechotypicola]|uniref:Riboflavin biosynthesis protein n=1 Tax=Herbiconiux moechotypicola TaxID=637393 RepID=A0ABP5Q2J4_9MICO|nr:bifunctional riboflavin kinase/FAD synthetase [Herbiconiux moechotypicola]MCS5728452.1 bifunctional riboflavin kinase/FAD synthetase [Herbiconiux moechotypicola]